jgi:hypothetical protein
LYTDLGTWQVSGELTPLKKPSDVIILTPGSTGGSLSFLCRFFVNLVSMIYLPLSKLRHWHIAVVRRGIRLKYL